MINSYLEKIKAHEKKVITGDILAEIPICVLCAAAGSNLSIHERRNRHVYIEDNGEVIDEQTLLSRLKCAICEKTFTHYPDFLVRYKRYIPEQILQLADKYRRPDSGYRKSIRHGYRTICWQAEDKWFSHVTLWRWAGYFGSQRILLKKALTLIRQRSPSSDIFRKIVPVFSEKYRSGNRKGILERAFRLIDIIKEYTSVFNKSFFPMFGTPMT